MFTVQVLSVLVSVVGVGLAAWMTYDLTGDLRTMYRSGTNGIKETQCWGALVKSMLLLTIQLMYLISSIAMTMNVLESRLAVFELTGKDVEAVRSFMAVRGALASSIICMITIVQRVLRYRLYLLSDLYRVDEQERIDARQQRLDATKTAPKEVTELERVAHGVDEVKHVVVETNDIVKGLNGK